MFYIGFAAIKALRDALKLVDGVEKVDSEIMDNLVQEYLYHFQIFAHHNGLFKQNRKDILEFQLTSSALVEEFEKPWNSERIEKSANRTDQDESSVFHDGMASSSILAENPSKVDPKRSFVESGLTPEKKQVKFARISPKKDLLEPFKCTLCTKVYTWLKALKRHMQQAHEAQVPSEMKERKDKVGCRICKSRIGRDLLTRHLKNIHGLEKLGSRTIFRGFITLDDSNWQPLWLANGESDPPPEMMVPIIDGKISLYGMEFAVEEAPVVHGSKNNLPVHKADDESVEEPIKAPDDKTFNNGNDKTEAVPGEKFQLFDQPLQKKSVEKGNLSTSFHISESGGKSGELMDLEQALSDLEVFESQRSDDEDLHHHVQQVTKGDNKYSDVEKEDDVEELDGSQDEGEDDQDTQEENLSQDEGNSQNEADTGNVKKISSASKYLDLDKLQDEFYQEEEDAKKIESKEGDVSRSKKSSRLKVEVFLVNSEDGEFWSKPEEWEVDSDFEDGDDKEYTEARIQLKKIRLERRKDAEMATKLCDMDENSSVIVEFERFLRSSKFETSTNQADLSTIRKHKGHLFLYEDSLLQYQYKKDPQYNLQRHFDPQSKLFLEVQDPTGVEGWINSIAGSGGKDNPGRRKEMLKSHARWREFVQERLENENFGDGAEGHIRRDMVLKNFDKISKKVKDKKLFSKLSNLETSLRSKKQQAREIVYPSNNYQEQVIVKNWFLSKEAKKEEDSCLKIYNSCLSGSKVGSKDFNKFANWARFNVVLEDRNRRSVYSFSNGEFAARRPKYLPEKTEVGDAVDKFDMLPDDWNPDVPHQEGEEPSCWVVDVSGTTKGLKGGRAAQIILTPRALECCLKYRDIKTEVFENVEDEAQFFVNIRGKPLTALQNTPGSLLDKLGSACGVNQPTVNSFRRAAEVKVQASPLMKASVENLQSHSRKVGLDHYDRSGDTTRANFIHQLSALESPSKAVVPEVPEAVKLKRQKEQEEDRERVLRKAKDALLQDRMKKKEKTSYLKLEDRDFLQKLFSSLKSYNVFPQDEEWMRIFYRTVDSLSDENGCRLRKVEEKLFKEFAKDEVEDVLGSWIGSTEQNKSADQRISRYVKSSFRVFEKTLKPPQKSFFKF